MKRRHVLAVLGLSFVTLGIYVIYWLYKTRQELLGYLPDKKAIPRVIWLFIPYLVMLVPLIVVFSLPVDSQAATVFNLLAIVIMMLSILAGLVISFWWFYRYFKAVEAVTQGNDAMLLYTLWIILNLVGLGPIWVLITQSDFNKFIDNGYRPLKMPAPQPYGPQPYQAPTQQYGQHPDYQQPYSQQPQPHHSHHPHEQHHPHQEQHGGQHDHHNQTQDGQRQNNNYPPQYQG